MKTILSRGTLALVSLALAACANQARLGAPTALPAKIPQKSAFRVGMNVTTTPGTDIADWQSFLQQRHFGLWHDNSDHTPGDGQVLYPSGVFDPETKEATARFQASVRKANGLADYHVAVTGEVNWCTYYRAIEAGWIPKTTLTAITRSHRQHGGPGTRNAHDVIHQIQLSCIDFSSTDKDVSDWQDFLIDMGYLGAGYPTGTFGSTTQMATKQFQIDFKLNVGTGIVALPTFTAAKANGMDSTYTFNSTTGCRTH